MVKAPTCQRTCPISTAPGVSSPRARAMRADIKARRLPEQRPATPAMRMPCSPWTGLLAAGTQRYAERSVPAFWSRSHGLYRPPRSPPQAVNIQSTPASSCLPARSLRRNCIALLSCWVPLESLYLEAGKARCKGRCRGSYSGATVPEPGVILLHLHDFCCCWDCVLVLARLPCLVNLFQKQSQIFSQPPLLFTLQTPCAQGIFLSACCEDM